MKKYLIIITTVVLLLMVFAPAAFAQDEGYGSGAGGYGGGYGDGGWGGGGYGDGGWGGGYGGYGGWDRCQQGNCYRVRYGDTLYSIGRRFNVHPRYIAWVNGLHNPNWIYAGQWLRIPATDGHPYPWNAHYRRPYDGGYGNCGYGGGYGNNCGYDGGYGNNCGYGGGYGNNCGYDGGYGGYDQGYGDY